MFIARESGFYSENCVDPENTDTPMSKENIGKFWRGGVGWGHHHQHHHLSLCQASRCIRRPPQSLGREDLGYWIF